MNRAKAQNARRADEQAKAATADTTLALADLIAAEIAFYNARPAWRAAEAVQERAATTITAADDKITPRYAYEGAGGWHDGRLGQAYDLVHAVLSEHSQKSYQHPLLVEIERLDEDLSACASTVEAR